LELSRLITSRSILPYVLTKLAIAILLRSPTHVRDLRLKVFSSPTVKSSLQECYRKAMAQINSQNFTYTQD
ncbi:hypothetical protein, partial [Mastigocoleus testarum]